MSGSGMATTTRDEIRRTVDTLFLDEYGNAALTLVVDGTSVAVQRPNYKPPRRSKKAFVVLGVDFDKPQHYFGGAIEKGHVRASVLVPSQQGSGFALAVCAELDKRLANKVHEVRADPTRRDDERESPTDGEADHDILSNSGLQVFASSVETIGIVGDNTDFFRVEWSAPYMAG